MRNTPYLFMLAGAVAIIASWVAAILLILAASDEAWAGEKKPKGLEFRMRASPQMIVVDSMVLLTAELVGEGEPEDLYCPEITWHWPDGTHSVEQSDCPAYDVREEYPRRWTRRVGVGAAGDGPITFRVELRTAKRRMLADVQVWAKGG